MQRWFAVLAAVLVAGLGMSLPVRAQPAVGADVPPLIAGRIALAEGDAQIWRLEVDQSGQWDVARVNDVVTIATGLHSGADGRIELRVGPQSYRLGANSRGGFSQLDYSGAVFNLEHGVLNVRLAPKEHGETTSTTVAGMRVELTAPGRYRIEADPNGTARVTTFEGHGLVHGANGTIAVGPGQAVSAAANLASASLEQAVPTAFDQWALGRDERYREVAATRHVSSYMTGYEELDLHGDWLPDVHYGTVWVPRAVPAGWAPYRHGQWRWVSPWGWTWVDHAPWGYAPSHYGRWVMIHDRWSWWPGGYLHRPVWAPALVGFVGSPGVNVSISIGGPVVGWYPLAPWHRYQPHFRTSPRYVTIINQTIINAPPRGVHRDINRERGGTMVPGPRFRDPVRQVALSDRSKFAQLQPISTPPPSAGWRRGDDRRSDRGDNRRGQRGEDLRQGRGEDRRGARVEDRQPSGPTRTAPVGEGQRPTRIAPPLTAAPVPGRGVTPPPALPGNEPRLAPPPQMRALPPQRQPQMQPPQIRPAPEMRPLPRPHLPADQRPPGPRPRFTDPAEPARTPPGAPPTVRQPTRGPSDRVAPPMRAQPVAPAQRAQPSSPPMRAQPVTPPAAVAAPAPQINQRGAGQSQRAGRPSFEARRAEGPRAEGRRGGGDNVVRQAGQSGRGGRVQGPRVQVN